MAYWVHHCQLWLKMGTILASNLGYSSVKPEYHIELLVNFYGQPYLALQYMVWGTVHKYY